MTRSDRSVVLPPGDDGELGVLLERHIPALHAFVRLRMGEALSSRESSADVVQSVCRELVRARGTVEFVNDAAFKSWLYSAALHKIMQKARHPGAQRRSTGREVAVDPDVASPVDLNLVTPSRVVSAKEEVERLEAAFAKLSSEDREVITLKKISGLSHAEVAERMSRSVEGSRTLLRRALVRLSALLQPERPGREE